MEHRCEPFAERPEALVITIELSGDDREAVGHYYPDGLHFALPCQQAGWAVRPEPGFQGAAWKDGAPVPGGCFHDGQWRGLVYPNGCAEILDKQAVCIVITNDAEAALAPGLEALQSHRAWRARSGE